MEDFKDLRDLREMVYGLIEKVDKLQDRVTELERNALETDPGVYYDHLSEEYVEFIDTKIGEKRRGE